MVAVINVDTYPFLAPSDLTCHLNDLHEQVFSGYTVLPNSKETKLESSKKYCVVAVPFLACKCVHTAISHGADISTVPDCLSDSNGIRTHHHLQTNWPVWLNG